MAEKKTIELDIQSNLGSLRSQLRAAQQEVAAMADQFGATSEQARQAAKRAAELKDRIEDAKKLTDTFNPEAKFNALGQSINAAAGAFTAVEGVMGLVGVESENLQKQLLKVQSALAITQGLEALGGLGDAFKNVKSIAIDAFKGIKQAIGSSGIGLIVILLGTVVAYWDDIKSAVSGVSEEQKRLNEKTALNAELAKDQLTTLNNQDNVLKLQGKSEREILNLKIQKYKTVIATTEAEIKNKKITSELEYKAAKRNKDLTEQLIRGAMEFGAVGLRLLAVPLDLVITAANKVSSVLGFGKITALDINAEITKLTEWGSKEASKFLFDPEQMKKDSDKALNESKHGLEQMKNELAGFKLQLKEIDKKDSSNQLKDKEDNSKKEIEIYEALEIKKADILKNSNTTLQGSINEALKMQQDAAELEIKILEGKALKAQQLNEKAHSQKVELVKTGFETIAQITEIFGKKGERAAKRAFEIQKAANIASALITTYQSANAAYASQFTPVPDPSSPIRGAIAAGLAIASGLANVAKITQQKFEGGNVPSDSGGNNAPSSTGASIMSPSFNVVGNSGFNQLAQLQQQPMKAYVVSGDVTTAQALDRNRIENATLVQ